VAVMEAGRLRYDLAVDLAKPRQHDMRYSPQFNSLCLEVRQAMDEAA